MVDRRISVSINEMGKSKVNVLKKMIDIRDGRSVCDKPQI